MKSSFKLAASMAFAICLGAAQANAAIINYVVPLSGANEVPSGSGDLDGSGTAFLTIDTSNNSISWNIVVANIDTVTLDHIHSGAAGVNGPIVVDFGGALVGSGLIDADLANVVLNPGNFYVNVHTSTFGGGAIRGQVPEPGTALLLGTGLVGLVLSTRRRSR